MTKQIYECCGCGFHSETRFGNIAFQDLTGIHFNIFVCADCQETLKEVQQESVSKYVSMLQEMANTARFRHPNGV